MESDDPVCLCFHVSYRKLASYIRVEKPSRSSQMSNCGGAGTGCGWCVPILEKMFDQAQAAKRDSRANAGEQVELPSADEYAAQRQQYISKKKESGAE